jgi:hypothetical protein
MNRLNYIIALYCGRRMHFDYSEKVKQDNLYFLRKHIGFLNEGTDIDLTTFILSIDPDFNLNGFIEEFVKLKKDFKYELVVKDNSGFSYSAWNYIINKNIDKFEYYFINEDDYIPVVQNFYEPFIAKCSDKSPYIPLMKSNNMKTHASFSCGALRGIECRKIYEKYGSVFKIIEGLTYDVAYTNQLNFYDYFFESGYELDDLINDYHLPYMDSSKHSITHYGSFNNPNILIPL